MRQETGGSPNYTPPRGYRGEIRIAPRPEAEAAFEALAALLEECGFRKTGGSSGPRPISPSRRARNTLSGPVTRRAPPDGGPGRTHVGRRGI